MISFVMFLHLFLDECQCTSIRHIITILDCLLDGHWHCLTPNLIELGAHPEPVVQPQDSEPLSLRVYLLCLSLQPPSTPTELN